MNNNFIIEMIVAIMFGFVMEAFARTVPTVAVFIASVMLSQIYYHSFVKEKAVKMIPKQSNFGKAMQIFKKKDL